MLLIMKFSTNLSSRILAGQLYKQTTDKKMSNFLREEVIERIVFYDKLVVDKLV